MSRPIDADALKEYITSACEDMKHLFNDGGTVAKLITESFCKDIDEQPTIKLKRKKGHWIPQDHNKKYGMITTTAYFYPKCSRCGNSDNYTNFCSKCGADMRGEQDEC